MVTALTEFSVSRLPAVLCQVTDWLFAPMPDREARWRKGLALDKRTLRVQGNTEEDSAGMSTSRFTFIGYSFVIFKTEGIKPRQTAT